MPPKGLRDPKLKAKARPNNWLEGTKANRWINHATGAMIVVFVTSCTAGMFFMQERSDRKYKAEAEKEENDLARKNERYLRLLRMRMELEDARKTEIKKILEDRLRRDASSSNKQLSE